MQRCGNGRGQEIGAQQSGYPQCEERLETPERYEPKEHADRGTQGNRMAGILKLEKLTTLVANPSDGVHSDEVTEVHPGMKQRILRLRQVPRSLLCAGPF